MKWKIAQVQYFCTRLVERTLGEEKRKWNEIILECPIQYYTQFYLICCFIIIDTSNYNTSTLGATHFFSPITIKIILRSFSGDIKYFSRGVVDSYETSQSENIFCAVLISGSGFSSFWWRWDIRNKNFVLRFLIVVTLNGWKIVIFKIIRIRTFEKTRRAFDFIIILIIIVMIIV